VDAASARRITRWALAEYAVPGAAIALVQDGRLVLAEGFGVRDLATGAPTTADTVFQLASVSKTFTAATVAALVDRKKLGWETPMVSVLPAFRLHDAYAGQWVNARDLLSHRAGFPAFFGDLFDHFGYDRADVLRRIRHVKPATSFRDRPAYSNIGYFLAGELGEPAESVYEKVEQFHLDSIACGAPLAVVDGNVNRVLARVLALAHPPRSREGSARIGALARAWLPAEHPGDWNQAVMDLGSTLCTPRHPRCPECPLRAWCRAFRAGRPEAFTLSWCDPAGYDPVVSFTAIRPARS
jgi:hypothetical protein